jgi:hypothetical protein
MLLLLLLLLLMPVFFICKPPACLQTAKGAGKVL